MSLTLTLTLTLTQLELLSYRALVPRALVPLDLCILSMALTCVCPYLCMPAYASRVVWSISYGVGMGLTRWGEVGGRGGGGWRGL